MIESNSDDTLKRLLFSNRYDKYSRYVGEEHFEQFKEYKAKNILTVAQTGFNTGEKEVPFDNRLKRSKLEVSFDGKNDHSSMHVKIKFEATPIPEGLYRVVDEYDKTISSFEIGDPTNEK